MIHPTPGDRPSELTAPPSSEARGSPRCVRNASRGVPRTPALCTVSKCAARFDQPPSHCSSPRFLCTWSQCTYSQAVKLLSTHRMATGTRCSIRVGNGTLRAQRTALVHKHAYRADAAAKQCASGSYGKSLAVDAMSPAASMGRATGTSQQYACTTSVAFALARVARSSVTLLL